MKIYKILTLAFFSGTILMNAQKIQTRSVSEFNKIEASGSAIVIYSTSDTLSLSVKAKDGEIEKVDTKVENNTLFISNKGRFTGPVYVYVKNNQLNEILVSGAASFKTTNAIKSESVYLNVSGSGNVYANLNSNKIKSIQSGASVLTLSGSTDVFNAELSGASSLKAYSLISKNTDIISTGAATSRVYVTGKLTANASGASDIKVKGDVTDISAEASSASSITKVLDTKGKDDSDSTIYNFKRKKIIIIDKFPDALVNEDSVINKNTYDSDEFKHWTGFSMGVNGYMNAPGDISLPASKNYMDLNYPSSFNFQFNIFERQFNIIKNNFKIVTGFGFDYHSYDFANKITLNPDSSYTGATIDSTGAFGFKKNRLRMTYLQVPLLLEFNTSNDPEKTFHIAFGVIGQFLVSSRTKQKFGDEKFEYEKTRKDSYNLSPFAAKAHVNLGYRGWTVFGEYSLTQLFQSGKGPELYPFTVGVRLVPFS